jgi:hypothetical protein
MENIQVNTKSYAKSIDLELASYIRKVGYI